MVQTVLDQITRKDRKWTVALPEGEAALQETQEQVRTMPPPPPFPAVQNESSARAFGPGHGGPRGSAGLWVVKQR